MTIATIGRVGDQGWAAQKVSIEARPPPVPGCPDRRKLYPTADWLPGIPCLLGSWPRETLPRKTLRSSTHRNVLEQELRIRSTQSSGCETFAVRACQSFERSTPYEYSLLWGGNMMRAEEVDQSTAPESISYLRRVLRTSYEVCVRHRNSKSCAFVTSCELGETQSDVIASPIGSERSM